MNSSLKGPGSRFWRSSLVFHGAFRIPDSVVIVSVGKNDQNLPRPIFACRSTAQTSGSSPRSARTPPSSLRVVGRTVLRGRRPPQLISPIGDEAETLACSARGGARGSRPRPFLEDQLGHLRREEQELRRETLACPRRATRADRPVRGSRTIVVAHSIISRRSRSVSAASCGSIGSAVRRTGTSLASGLIAPDPRLCGAARRSGMSRTGCRTPAPARRRGRT